MALALPNVAPLARRMRAWWNGLELTGEAGPALLPAPSSAPCEAAPVSVEMPPIYSKRKAPLWTKPRFHLMERVWGTGFSGPGNAEWVAALVSPLALDSKMTVVNLGAGLGGVARAIAESAGVWVTGYESRPDFVEAGMELSKLMGYGQASPHPRL